MKKIIILLILLSFPLVLSEEVNFGVGDSVSVTVVRYHNETQDVTNNTAYINETNNTIEIEQQTQIKQENVIINNTSITNNEVCSSPVVLGLFFKYNEKCKLSGIQGIFLIIILSAIFLAGFYIYKIGQRKDLNTLNNLNY